MVPTAMAYVRSALRTTGIETSTGGYYMHKIQVVRISLYTHTTFLNLGSARINAEEGKKE